MNDPLRHARILAGALVVLAAVLMACQQEGPVEPDPMGSLSEGNDVLPPTDRHSMHPVPYRGTLVTTEQVGAAPPPGCEAFFLTAQEGTATHLGHYTGTGTTCAFNGQLGVLDSPIDPQGAPPPYFVTDFSVEQTHVAANGDMLEISGTGVLVQSLIDGSRVFFGNATIDGGTGRFAGATGTFNIEAARGEDPRFDGWMVFDASNRSNR